MTDSECDGCPNFHYENLQKSGYCGLVDRQVRFMDECPIEQPITKEGK